MNATGHHEPSRHADRFPLPVALRAETSSGLARDGRARGFCLHAHLPHLAVHGESVRQGVNHAFYRLGPAKGKGNRKGFCDGGDGSTAARPGRPGSGRASRTSGSRQQISAGTPLRCTIGCRAWGRGHDCRAAGRNAADVQAELLEGHAGQVRCRSHQSLLPNVLRLGGLPARHPGLYGSGVSALSIPSLPGGLSDGRQAMQPLPRDQAPQRLSPQPAGPRRAAILVQSLRRCVSPRPRWRIPTSRHERMAGNNANAPSSPS